MSKSIQIIGLGYIGLPTAAVMARAGMNIHGVDINPRAVNAINEGRPHIHEEGLEEILRQAVQAGKLKASLTPIEADVHIIAVPTPINPDKSPDLSYVESATRTLLPVIKAGDLVIIESTIPPRTCEDVVAPIIEQHAGLSHLRDYYLVHCPERVIPGKILHEIVYNDRIIGGTRPEATALACDVYAQFVKGALLRTDATTAEMCKLMENTYRDVNIALANELSQIAERLGINIFEAIAFANRHPRVNIHQPGIGVGGHCIPVDPWFIVHAAPDLAELIATSRKINDHRPHEVAERVIQVARAQGFREVIFCGLAYKPDVDDLRESPAVEVVDLVVGKVQKISVVEPYIGQIPAAFAKHDIELIDLAEALNRDALLVKLVDHSNFEILGMAENKTVLSSRNNFMIRDVVGIEN